jgi:hypothetical protein
VSENSKAVLLEPGDGSSWQQHVLEHAPAERDHIKSAPGSNRFACARNYSRERVMKPRRDYSRLRAGANILDHGANQIRSAND